VQADHDDTWAAPPASTSYRCAGCGRALTLTRRSRQPESADHEANCKEYRLAVRVMQYAAELTRMTSELADEITSDDAVSWRHYCQEAAHDLDFVALATSVSDALEQKEVRYAEDRRPDGNRGSHGRSAAAEMLMLACRALSRGRKTDRIALRIPP
jgi:hypothetical protein